MRGKKDVLYYVLSIFTHGSRRYRALFTYSESVSVRTQPILKYDAKCICKKMWKWVEPSCIIRINQVILYPPWQPL